MATGLVPYIEFKSGAREWMGWTRLFELKSNPGPATFYPQLSSNGTYKFEITEYDVCIERCGNGICQNSCQYDEETPHRDLQYVLNGAFLIKTDRHKWENSTEYEEYLYVDSEHFSVGECNETKLEYHW